MAAHDGGRNGPVRPNAAELPYAPGAEEAYSEHRTCVLPVMAPPPPVDSHPHSGHGLALRPSEPANWRHHGPRLRMLAVAIVLTVAAASAGLLMALMGD